MQISLFLEDGDQEELDNLTRQLKAEIEQLQIELVEDVVVGKTPEGAKALDWVAVGNMTVTLAPIVFPSLIDLLKSWVERKPTTPVKIRIKVGKNKTAQIEYDPTKTSTKELEDLVKSLTKSIKK